MMQILNILRKTLRRNSLYLPLQCNLGKLFYKYAMRSNLFTKITSDHHIIVTGKLITGNSGFHGRQNRKRKLPNFGHTFSFLVSSSKILFLNCCCCLPNEQTVQKKETMEELTECWQNVKQNRVYHSDESSEDMKDLNLEDGSDEEESATELNQQEVTDICEAIEAERLNVVHLREERIPIEELPEDVQRRIRALKNNQIDITLIEAQFYHDMQELEIKYEKIMKEHFDKRRDIITGSYEPTNEECELKLGSDETDNEGETSDKPPDSQPKSIEEKENGKKFISTEEGIPLFWTTIFQTVDTLAMMTDDRDLPILQSLTDIRVTNLEEPMGFKLQFHFSPNEYFNNEVLTKTYIMKWEVDPEDPFSYEGPEIVKCKGCAIDWKQGKDVTMKIVDRKQRNKRNGTIRILKKAVKTRSFFHFFNPPNPDDAMDDEIEDILTSDFELGQYFRERIIPRAILYYTGEAVEEDSEEEYTDSSEEETGEEDEAVEQIVDVGEEIGEHDDHPVPAISV